MRRPVDVARLFALLALGPAAAASWPAVASAEESLAVLGLVSEEGDDDLAAAFTRALRAEAAAEGGFEVSSTTASLAQMTMAQDCEIAEADCRKAIGAAIKADRVLYGAVRQGGAKGHTVEAHLFDTETGRETVAERSFSGKDGGADALARPARELLRSLIAPPEEPAEPSSDDAAPAVPTATPDVAPLADAERDEPKDSPPASSGSNDWLGYSLIGVGAVSVGLAVFSMIQVDQANEDPELLAYRRRVPPAAGDACDEIDEGTSHGASLSEFMAAGDACNQGRTFSVLQYVFIATAAVSGGIGIYFLLDDEGEQRASAPGRAFALSPHVARDGAALIARGSF